MTSRAFEFLCLALVAVLVAVVSSTQILKAQEDCSEPQAIQTAFGKEETASGRIDGASLSQTIPAEGARYVRALLSYERHSSCGWFLTVRDEAFHPLQVFTAAEFDGASQRWTVRVPGSRVRFDLKGCKGSEMPVLVISRLIKMPASATASASTYYSVRDKTSPWQNLYDPGQPTVRLPRVPSGDYVGMLMSSLAGPNLSGVIRTFLWTCSGVMIGPSMYLTNWHCGGPDPRDVKLADDHFWTPDVIRNILIDMSWDDDQISEEYSATRLVAASPELDLAVLEIHPVRFGGRTRSATFRESPPSVNEPLYIVHHPLALRKQYSGQCSVQQTGFANWRSAANRSDLVHDCNTEGGSSGAPLFDSDGLIVGLHHLPYTYKPGTCEITSRNKAVSSPSIVRFLTGIPEIGTNISVR